jgi:hypothetical protein
MIITALGFKELVLLLANLKENTARFVLILPRLNYVGRLKLRQRW